MPGRAGKVKGSKQRLEKKERKEKIPPVVVPIIVNTPDGRQVELKGISTDVLLDVRHYLIQHVDTTHLTNYSFSHEIRGDKLPDTLELSALRPCVLDMVEEEYTEKQAVAHVRRLLDIVACTTAFGPSGQQKKVSSSDEPKGSDAPTGTSNGAASGSHNGLIERASSGVNGTVEGAVDGVESVENGGFLAKETGGASEEEGDASAAASGTIDEEPPKENGHVVPKGLGFGLGSSARKKAENGVSEAGSAANPEEKAGNEAGSGDLEGKAVKDLANGLVKSGGKAKLKGKGDAMKAMAAAEAAVKRGDREGMYPIPTLGTFYEFLSMAHLQSPLQSIKRSAKQPSSEDRSEGNYFSIDVRLCNGKLVTVTASRTGFYPVGKPSAAEHELLDVLRKQSGAFTQAYDDLIQGFLDRNQFGNIPTGFRANTFVVPPPFAQNPSNPQELPVEDEQWGGNGGGGGLEELERDRPWKALFKRLQGVPCGTPEERIVRDRKAFLLHNLFVDVAIRTAIDVVRGMTIPYETSGPYINGFETLHETERSNLRVTVKKEAPLPGGKRGVSNSGPFVVVPNGADVTDDIVKTLRPLDDFATADTVAKDVLDRKNVLKGLVADESTALADLPTLGMVTVYYQGLTVVVHAEGDPSTDEELDAGLEVEQLDGGENALNVNSLRVLLHRAGGEKTEGEDKQSDADKLLAAVLEKGQGELERGDQSKEPVLRWELGACWIQHLQDEKKKQEEEAKKAAEEKEARVANGEVAETAVELVHVGERKGFKVEARPLRKDEDVKPAESKEETEGEREQREKNEAALQALLNDVAWKKVVDSKTGLHGKSVDDLLAGARTFRDEVALPKLIADFASLELSPVDGRTLTDFMHTRGLNMNQLGQLARKADELPHIKEMCIMEMETRAFKRILKAAVAACPKFSLLASVLASGLSAFLGEGPLAADTWQWVKKFVELHYGYKLPENARSRLRKLEVLRGLCHKVGIEIAPWKYDLASARPLHAADVISMVPVYKSVACTTADGRQLLEQSKLALDKGKLDESVQSGCKALSKIIAVCGPCHRMTAGAYSLLAVVLYHTGDFNQATIYQQKALDINERELGLDHPDTMKSFGDLAVFYYRLQHTELALKYVHRALYLLNLICGSEHPNSAATYINVAMMEEGMGNVPIALRYLHEALKCNERLLGADHIQTAAAYHALAIVLSLMEAYSLSVQHEETTFRILTDKLGPDDLKTQDAAAWLDYFDSKALEQQEVARTGGRKPDATIASKGHLSVDDLLNFINKEADQKEGAHKRAKRPPQPIYQRFRAAVSPKPAPVSETPDSSSSETGSETESEEPVSSQEGVTSEEEADVVSADVAAPEPPAVAVPEVDDGEWQEATPRSKAQKLAHSSNPPPQNRAFSPRGNFSANRGAFSGAHNRAGFVRDVSNRYPRPNPRENGLRLPGVRPGYKPGPKNSHSPRSVLPKPALRVNKPVELTEQPRAGPQSSGDPPGDGLLTRPSSEGPVKEDSVAAAPSETAAAAPTGPLETEENSKDAVSPASGGGNSLKPVKSWSFKDIVMAKARKTAPGVPTPLIIPAAGNTQGESSGAETKALSTVEAADNQGSDPAAGAATGPPDPEAVLKTDKNQTKIDVEAPLVEKVASTAAEAEAEDSPLPSERSDRSVPASEPSVPASETCHVASDPSPSASMTTSERSESPALSESSSQRSVPLTPFCKKSDTPPLPQITIPVPLPGPAVVPVTPVRRFPSPAPAQPAFQQGPPQFAYPPLLPTPQFRVQYPLPSNNYHYQNVNGVHVPVPMQTPPSPHYGHPVYPPPPTMFPQYSPPPQWSPQPSARPFRPNPLAVEFKPSGSPPLQNPSPSGAASPTLNPAAAEFVPRTVGKTVTSPKTEDTVAMTSAKVESVGGDEVDKEADAGASPVENEEKVEDSGITPNEDEKTDGVLSIDDEEAAAVEENGQGELDGENAAPIEEKEAAPESSEIAQPSVVTASHPDVDDVTAAVLSDAKAAAEAAIKAALAKGGSGTYGSLGGLKLSADAPPFQPSALMSRTKSCGSLSQDGERDMVSVSVR